VAGPSAHEIAIDLVLHGPTEAFPLDQNSPLRSDDDQRFKYQPAARAAFMLSVTHVAKLINLFTAY
jgi:hypothetical protein